MAATLSGGAALVSILSYTSSAGIAVPGAPPAMRAHSLTVRPAVDTAHAIGDTIQLAALIADSGGAVIAGVSPAWTSGDPSVADVSPAGTVTTRGAGTASVIVRVGTVETRSHIVVRQRPAALQLDDTLLRVPEGERGPLTARVLDARGNPIVGADVTWSAPDPAVARVEGAEVVGVSPGRTSFLAMAGQLQAMLPVEVTPVPGSITVLEGDSQRGAAGRALPVAITAQIVSRSGRPMPGVVAAFRSVAPATGDLALDTSDARGLVRATWRLSDVPGRQQLSISVDGVSAAPVVGAEADPVPENTKVELVSRELAGVVGDTLREPIVLRVTDSVGRALADLPVTWSGFDGGAVTAHAARTDSLGEAKATWRLGPRSGRQRARAQIGNARTLPAAGIVATAGAGPASALVLTAGDRQLGAVGQRLPQRLVLQTVDSHGNPVPGADVQLRPSAGSVADSSLTSDSTGRARVAWTLGRAAGLQHLSIRLAGDTVEVEATALARAGKPTSLAFVNPPESGKPGRALPRPVVVHVTDAYGNPIAGQTVVFSPSSGSVAPARGLTDSAGRTTVRWTLGPKAKRPELAGAVAGTAVRGKLVVSARP